MGVAASSPALFDAPAAARSRAAVPAASTCAISPPSSSGDSVSSAFVGQATTQAPQRTHASSSMRGPASLTASTEP